MTLLGCGAGDQGDQVRSPADRSTAQMPAGQSDIERTLDEQIQPAGALIDWKISWEPATTREDKTRIKTAPIYELEMADDENSDDWKVVWTGTRTTAEFQAPPGRHCFRAVTLEKKSRSKPSTVTCATKGPASAG